MSYTFPGRHIKLFGKAIHCLSKIGDELYIESVDKELSIRTVNSSRSAYGCFHFDEAFFVDVNHTSSQEQRKHEKIKVKISMKSCLGIFKSLSNLEKIVDFCKMECDEKASRLVFTLSCRHGIVKTHNLSFQECESLEAVFAKELCQNMIKSSARTLQDCVVNFPAQCEEISLSVTPQHVRLKNYVEDESDFAKHVHSQMTLSPEEFEDCRIGLDTEITFCLKELRAIIGFSETVSQPINIHFETGGRPVSFSLGGDGIFTGDFVLASLAEPSESQHTQTKEQQTVTGNGNCAAVNPASVRSNFEKERRNVQSTQSGRGSSVSCAAEDHQRSSGQKIPNPQNSSKQNKRPLEEDQRPAEKVADETETEERIQRASSQANDDFFTDSFPYKDVFSNNSRQESSQVLNTSAVVHSGRSAALTSPRSSQKGPNVSKVSLPRLGDSCPLQEEEEDKTGTDDNIPGTPPAKRHRVWLLGADSEQQEEEPGLILAQDTDEED